MDRYPSAPLRRRLLLGGSSIAATAALSACGGGDDSTALAPVSDSQLNAQVAAKLTAQLGDASIAAAIQPALMDVGFAWGLPTIPAAQVNMVIAYGFGNRPNAASGTTSSTGGNQAALPDPGPVNEALADAVYRIYRLKQVKVYAQWEIARFLVSKYQMGSRVLTSIEPIVANDGSIVYLSTDGVAAAVVKLEGSAAAMGRVAVVGHRDHAKRCILTSQMLGMNAFAVAEVPLPTMYDSLSGQAWTRDRKLYLVHDMYAQMATKAALLSRQLYPNG